MNEIQIYQTKKQLSGNSGQFANKIFHFGASLKDLGKKWFAFSKFEKDALTILEKLEL